MGIFTIPFKTERPIFFRERDAQHPEIDLSMDACITGKTVVYGFDNTLFRNEEEVEGLAQPRIQLAIVNCFINWPADKSVMHSDKNGILCEAIKTELAKIGVTAEVEEIEFTPSARSEEMYTRLCSLISAQNQSAAPAAVSFCGNCGAKRIEGARFCTSCGTKFE